MQETVLNQEHPKLDLSKVAALQQKRTLAFVNHFVVTTVQFLNNFTKQCEQKLMHFERKLEKVEAAMVLLETRLSSIPEVSNITTPHENPETTQATDTSTSYKPEEHNSKDQPDVSIAKEDEEVQTPPEYMKFVKMVQVGVPLDAVKLKASVEGLDPGVLEKILHR